MVTLKDGTEVEDPRLARLVHFDPRSRDFPVTAVLKDLSPRSYTWRIDAPWLLDQGREGACTGFALANELQARPAEVELAGNEVAANLFAVRNLYWEAQKVDPWPGGSYPGASPTYSGSSVLAAVKVGQRLGYFEQYRWSFGLDELVLGLGRHGPALLGLAWFDSNYEPDEDGFISPDGQVVGGHAILARAVKVVWLDDVKKADTRGFQYVDLDQSYITLRNSWGEWGHEGSGDCYVTLRDMERWLRMQGEACFMVRRTTDPEV